MEAAFRLRRDQEDARPPRTWAAQRNLSTQGVNLPERGFAIGEPLAERAASKDNSRRFQAVDKEASQKIAQYRQEVEKSREERRKLESEGDGRLTDKPPKEFVPVKVKLPRSPIMAKPFGELGQEDAPPKIYDVPQPDPKVAAKLRGESRDMSRRRSEGQASAAKRKATQRRSEKQAQRRSEGQAQRRSEGQAQR